MKATGARSFLVSGLVSVLIFTFTAAGSAAPTGSLITALNARQSGEGQVTLTWSHYPSAPKTQRLEIYESRNGKRVLNAKIKLSPLATARVIENLAPGRRYTFQIKSTPKAVRLAESSVLLLSKPAPVRELKAEWTSGGLYVSWAKVSSGILVGITVTGPGGFERSLSASGDSAGILVSGTNPTLRYQVSAITSNPAGISTPVRIRSGEPSAEIPTTPTVPETPVSPPTKITLELTGSRSVLLRWEGAEAERWRITILSPGNAKHDQVLSFAGSARMTIIEGLTQGVSYRFSVGRIKASSLETTTSTAIFIPPAVSAAEGIVTEAGDGEVTLNWSAGSGGEVRAWRISMRVPPSANWVLYTITTEETVRITGLANGIIYQFLITPLDQFDEPGPSVVVGALPQAEEDPSDGPIGDTPSTARGEVTGVVRDSSILVEWGGAVATEVLWQTTGATTWNRAAVGAASSSYTITGLSNGELYRVRVLTANGTDVGPVLELRPLGLSQAVRNLSAIPGYSQITLSWQVPANTGGFALAGYWVRWSGSAGNGEVFINPFSNSVAVTGLENGVSYRVSVTPVTDLGEGPSSSTTATPIP